MRTALREYAQFENVDDPQIQDQSQLQAPQDVVKNLEMEELRASIRDCWEKLPVKYQNVFKLRFFDADLIFDSAKPTSLISSILGISEGLVKYRLFHARLLIKRCLIKKGFQP